MEAFTFILKNGNSPVHAEQAPIAGTFVSREDFPLLANRPELVYLDNASTTQKPRSVIDAMTSFYENSNANVHRAVYGLAEEATSLFETSRATIADFIGAETPREIIFTRGTTEALNLLAHSASRAFLSQGDEILLTTMEHHSNIVPWQIAAQERGYKLSFIPVTRSGELDIDQLKALWTPRTRLLSMTHVSNVLGSVNPVRVIVDFAHERGALIAVDAAQSAGHGPLSVQELGCDFLAFSGHKMYGPLGIGILWGRRKLLEAMPPYQGGGEMIMNVTLKKSTYNEVPYKFEAGTPNIAGAVGIAAAAAFLTKIGRTSLEARELALTRYSLEKLSSVDGLTIYGGSAVRAPVFSFNLEGVHSHDTAQFLDRESVAVRSGHHCAQPLLHEIGAKSAARASLAIYNTYEDIDKLAAGLNAARRYFTK